MAIPLVRYPLNDGVMMDFNGYVPALTDSVLNELIKKWEWLDNKAIVKYPSFLISAEYGMKYPNFREKYKIPRDTLLFGDSGGVQITTKGKFFDPIEVLRWLENNVDIGFVLDIPPPFSTARPLASKLKELGLFNHKDRAKQSARYYEIMERNRQNYNIKILKVLHGVTKTDLEYWYELTKNIEFDGWALASKPSGTPIIPALHYSFLADKEEMDYWLHYFAISGFTQTLPTIYYIKSKLKRPNEFSFDSSTWILGKIARKYLLPFTNFYLQLAPYARKLDILDSLEKYEPQIVAELFGISNSEVHRYSTEPHRKISANEVDKFGTTPCPCPICSTYSLNELLNNGMLISLHNLWLILLHCKLLDFLSKDPNLIEDYIKIECSARTIEAVEFIKYSEIHGFEQAWNKYKFSLLKSVKKTIPYSTQPKQLTLL